ncbi:GNAT family N-acetyltransferase [Streptomyces brevispora]|uniref:Acetyltransferase (GNAT) family protein n=1 Tax=Streptomyces brevispora TaxID=887462 RepID=A0A561TXS7_9ACTN|nr:GNAT family N-acetyltransferase [Streptomyces brevispora]TWF91929.1 acetyltransferase (GNAT) family protein [Streptomyces brevispora]WSC17367.1 GNAT family N-acetyltransferase [Streptomyces brevispora]
MPSDNHPQLGTVRLRDARADDAGSLTRLLLASRAAAMPYLPRVHSDEATLGWMTHVVLPDTDVWVAELHEEGGAAEIVGFVSLDGDELEQLYLSPGARRRGIGTRLLAKAKEHSPEGLALYAFQRNTDARAFYERHGFTAVEFNDGSRNEEGEPDVRYRWTAKG